MNCPYCAEKIEDAAVVCKSCRRDFSLLAPVLLLSREHQQRLDALERRLGEMSAVSAQPTPESPWVAGSLVHSTFAVIAATGIATFAYSTWSANDRVTDGIGGVGSIAFFAGPLVIGAWQGAGQSGFHLFAYVVTGALVGLGVFAGLQAAGESHLGYWWWYLAWGISSNVAGALIGDVVERWRSPKSTRHVYARGVATRLAHLLSSDPEKLERNVDLFSKLIGIATALVSLLSMLVAGGKALKN